MWLAGAAYLPLDPGYPAARLGFMLADSRAALVVGTAAGCRAGWPAGRVPVVETWMTRRSRRRLAGDAAGAAGWWRLAAGQLAYVIYTSGSTGAPKGVAVAAWRGW